MQVVNVHRRVLQASAGAVGLVLDTLSSQNDRLWPTRAWPRMRLDRPLGRGAVGGHGPIRYRVEAYAPGRSITFRFLAPRGFDGFHALHVVPIDAHRTELRHTLQMRTHGVARITWPLLYRPLHDALIEDALDCAASAVGPRPVASDWGAQVRFLRWLVACGHVSMRLREKRS